MCAIRRAWGGCLFWGSNLGETNKKPILKIREQTEYMFCMKKRIP